METIYLRDEFVLSDKTDNILTALARANCLNISNEVNFNKYGVKDNIGLIPVSSIFIDSFILQLKSLINETGNDLTNLRNFLNSYGMACSVVLPINNGKFKIACPDYDI